MRTLSGTSSSCAAQPKKVDIDNQKIIVKTKKEAQTPNLIVTCHSGFYSVQAAWEMRHKAAEIVRRIIDGGEIENCINCRFLPRNFIK